MKKQLWILIAAAMLAAALGGCGGQEDVSEPASEPTSPVSSESTPEEASGTAASDPEPAGEQPVGEFWSIPDETVLSSLPSELMMELELFQLLRPAEGWTEDMTVGEVKAYWQNLSPEDERLTTPYQMAQSYTLQLEHTVPVLREVGDTISDGTDSITLSELQSDGFVTCFAVDFSGETGGEYVQEWGKTSPLPGYTGSYGHTVSLENGVQERLIRFSSLPFSQLADHSETPFPYDLDIMLEDYMVDTKTAVFPKINNTREGFVPVSAQLSPLSLAVTFSPVGVTPAGVQPDGTITLEMTGMQPVKLLSGGEVRYTFSEDEAYGWMLVHNAGDGFLPVTCPTVAGAYDLRPLQTLTVCAGPDDGWEIFPDYGEIDAIEFEGVVYPLQ